MCCSTSANIPLKITSSKNTPSIYDAMTLKLLKRLPKTTLPTEEQLTQIFSYNVRHLRLAANLTQKEYTAILGYSISTIQSYELGHRIVPFAFLFAQSQVFNISLSSLFHILPDISLKEFCCLERNDLPRYQKERWNTIYGSIKKNIFIQAREFPSIAAFARHCHLSLDVIYRLHQENPEISLHTVHSICTALSLPLETLVSTP